MESKDGLSFKEIVKQRISRDFEDELAEVPDDADAVALEKWMAHRPTFLKKTTKRVNWSSRVVAHMAAYKDQSRSDWESEPAATFGHIKSTSTLANLAQLANVPKWPEASDRRRNGGHYNSTTGSQRQDQVRSRVECDCKQSQEVLQ